MGYLPFVFPFAELEVVNISIGKLEILEFTAKFL